MGKSSLCSLKARVTERLGRKAKKPVAAVEQWAPVLFLYLQ